MIPGGESYAKVYERAVAWLATVPEDRLLIAVAHQIISRTIRGAYCQLDPNSILTLNHPHMSFIASVEAMPKRSCVTKHQLLER